LSDAESSSLEAVSYVAGDELLQNPRVLSPAPLVSKRWCPSLVADTECWGLSAHLLSPSTNFIIDPSLLRLKPLSYLLS